MDLLHLQQRPRESASCTSPFSSAATISSSRRMRSSKVCFFPLMPASLYPDSLALFQEGAKLITACSAQLDQAEQQVVKLMKGPDGAPAELPFEDGEE